MPVKTNLILISLLMLCNVLVAQTIDYDLATSGDSKLKMGQYFDQVIFDNKDVIYTITRRKITGFIEEKTIDVELYDRSLKKLKKKSLSLEYKSNLLQYEALKYLNGKLYLFTSFFNSAKKKNYLFMEVYDGLTLKRLQRMEIVGEFESVNRYESGFIGFEENTFTKIKDVLRQTFQNLGIKGIEFNTGRDVYNFLKDYNKSMASGKGIKGSILDVAKKGAKGSCEKK